MHMREQSQKCMCVCASLYESGGTCVAEVLWSTHLLCKYLSVSARACSVVFCSV